jgi:hypothetical protein
MMKKIALLVFGTFLFQPVIAQHEELPEQYRDEVQFFINCIKTKNITAISKLTLFPLERRYPIPSIKDSAELRTRFSEVFDDSLIALITSSNVEKDWSQMGWRGIMLGRGVLWLQDDGTLQTVNYQSKVEAEMQQELIEKERKSLHVSLQEYSTPGVILETSKFRIRIDLMEDETYRYASWGINKQMSDEPDIILKDGILEFDGSGGNHHYVFKNKNYQYICWIFVLGSDETPDAHLELLAGKKEILNQEAEIIRP